MLLIFQYQDFLFMYFLTIVFGHRLTRPVNIAIAI